MFARLFACVVQVDEARCEEGTHLEGATCVPDADTGAPDSGDSGTGTGGDSGTGTGGDTGTGTGGDVKGDGYADILAGDAEQGDVSTANSGAAYVATGPVMGEFDLFLAAPLATVPRGEIRVAPAPAHRRPSDEVAGSAPKRP